jgi:hypothetical protein
MADERHRRVVIGTYELRETTEVHYELVTDERVSFEKPKGKTNESV